MRFGLAAAAAFAAVPACGRFFTPWYRTTLHAQVSSDSASSPLPLNEAWKVSSHPARWLPATPISGVADGSIVKAWPKRCSQTAQRGIRKLIHAHGPVRDARVRGLEQLHLATEHGQTDDELFAFCCRPHWDVVDPGFDNFFDARLDQMQSGQVCWDMARPRRAFLDYVHCCFPILRGLLAADPPAWLLEEIREDIEDAAAGVAAVNESVVWRDHGHLCKVRVDRRGVYTCDGSVWGANNLGRLYTSTVGMKIHWVVSSLDVAHALGGWFDSGTAKTPAVEFFVSGAYWDDKNSLIGPVLTTSKIPGGRGFIRVPRFCLSWLDRFVTRELIPLFNSRPELMDWRMKEDRMVWRGCYTLPQTKCTCPGHTARAADDVIKSSGSQCACEILLMETYQNSSQSPNRLCDHVRCQAVELSHEFPEDFDFRMSWNKPAYPIDRGDMRRWLEPMELEQMLAYRYVLDIEGSYMSTMRPYWLLLSKQLLFRQVSLLRTFAYHKALQPFEHYIPVREDLSDLRERLAWARAHPEECERIVSAAWEFGRQYLSREYGMYIIHVIVKELARATARQKA